VITLDAATVHNDPSGQAVEMLDHEEIIRIAELAVDRFAFDG